MRVAFPSYTLAAAQRKRVIGFANKRARRKRFAGIVCRSYCRSTIMPHHAAKMSLALIMLLAGGCGDPEYVIVPGKPTQGPSAATPVSAVAGKQDFRTLSGSFRIVESSAPDAIASARRGGACLIADLNHLNIPDKAAESLVGGSCNSDAECTAALSEDQIEKKWSSYCVAEKERVTPGGVVPAKRSCWTRPGSQPAYCNVNGLERPLDQAIAIPADAKDLPEGAKPGIARPFPLHEGGVKWRLRACLNGADATSGPPCAGHPGTKLVVDGPVFILPVPPAFTPPPQAMPPKDLPKKPGA